MDRRRRNETAKGNLLSIQQKGLASSSSFSASFDEQYAPQCVHHSNWLSSSLDVSSFHSLLIRFPFRKCAFDSSSMSANKSVSFSSLHIRIQMQTAAAGGYEWSFKSIGCVTMLNGDVQCDILSRCVCFFSFKILLLFLFLFILSPSLFFSVFSSVLVWFEECDVDESYHQRNVDAVFIYHCRCLVAFTACNQMDYRFVYVCVYLSFSE